MEIELTNLLFLGALVAAVLGVVFLLRKDSSGAEHETVRKKEPSTDRFNKKEVHKAHELLVDYYKASAADSDKQSNALLMAVRLAMVYELGEEVADLVCARVIVEPVSKPRTGVS